MKKKEIITKVEILNKDGVLGSPDKVLGYVNLQNHTANSYEGATVEIFFHDKETLSLFEESKEFKITIEPIFEDYRKHEPFNIGMLTREVIPPPFYDPCL